MLNSLDLQGRFVADPELKQTNSGMNVVNFKFVWSEKYKDKERKCYLEVKAFGAQAEHICNYYRKGQEAIVEGRLETEEWENQDGQKRSKIVLMLNRINFCGKKQDNPVATPAATEQPGGFTAVETDELPFDKGLVYP